MPSVFAAYRKLGKKGSKKVGDDRGLGNTTERVRYIERSKASAIGLVL